MPTCFNRHAERIVPTNLKWGSQKPASPLHELQQRPTIRRSHPSRPARRPMLRTGMLSLKPQVGRGERPVEARLDEGVMGGHGS